MARRSGRARRGEHLIGAIPHGHRKTTTFVAALREDRIAAPLVIDRAMNGTIFKAWVEQFLAPGLGPGDIVIMDNLPVHKVSAPSIDEPERIAVTWRQYLRKKRLG